MALSEVHLFQMLGDAASKRTAGPVIADGHVSPYGVASWSERATLEGLEVLLGTSHAAFVIQGLAFRAIEQRRIWPSEYATFPDYLLQRWGLAYPTAATLMRSAEVMVLLEEGQYTNGISAFPTSERTARELSPLRDSPGELVEAWLEAIQSAPRKADGTVHVTARHLRSVVVRYRPALAGRREALVRAQLEGAPEPGSGATLLGLVAVTASLTKLSQTLERTLGSASFSALCDEVDAADLGETIRGAEHWLKKAKRQVSAIRRKKTAGA